jgi:hypothetical protein
MPNDRLTTRNQWGEVLYCGKFKHGEYKGIGDIPIDLSNEAVEEIITKLYYFEEYFEELTNQLEVINGKRDSN